MGLPKKRFSAKIKGRLARRVIKRLPRGAILFPKLSTRKMDFDWNEVGRVMDHCNASELFLLHGNAMKIGNRAVVVTGPMGIGKSTVLRKLAGKGVVEPISDGSVIVARIPTGFLVIGNGNYQNERRYSVIRKVLRGGRLYRSYFASPKTTKLGFKIGQKIESLMANATAAMHLSTIRDKSNQLATISEVPLGKIIFIEHEKDTLKPSRMNREKIWEIGNEEAKRELRGQAQVVEMHSFEKGLQKRLQREILS